jgi:AraC-like DNA-binding protein
VAPQLAGAGSGAGRVHVSRVIRRTPLTRPWHPQLRTFVRGYAGYEEAVASPYRVRMVPTARAVVVINLAEPFTRVRRLGAPESGSGTIGSLVVGLEDRPAVCEHPGGQEAIRLELTPLGAYRLFAVPMRELTNHILDLRDIMGAWAGELAEQLAASRDWAARFDLLDAALLARLAQGPAASPEVGRAWWLLSRSSGEIPVARIAAEVGWSQKHLIRRFTEQIGLGPKASARVLRFNRAVEMISRTGAGLADVSAACGFYDQAHLNREFRRFAGTTPGTLSAARRVEGALAL